MIEHDSLGQRIVIAPRRAGKTTALVEWVREDPANRMILTHSQDEAQRLQREFHVGAVGPTNARVDLQKLGPTGQFAVDNALEVLRNFIGRNPAAVAINDEGAIDESAEIVLLRDRDRLQKDEIAALHKTIDTLIEMAGLRCHCDTFNGPEQDCPWHGDQYAVIDHRNPHPEHLATIAEGLRLTQKETTA